MSMADDIQQSIDEVNAIFARREICRVEDCSEFAQVLVDVDLVLMDDGGVERLDKQVVAMCRRHALAEQEKALRL